MQKDIFYIFASMIMVTKRKLCLLPKAWIYLWK